MMVKIGFVLFCFLVSRGVHSTHKAVCRIKYTPENGKLMNCSHMHLTSVPDVDVSDVTVFDISHNKLSEWSPASLSGVTSLRHLRLGHNVLQKLDQHAFEGLVTLETLQLSFNHLSALSPRTFVHLPHLQRLLLDHNNLTNLQEDVFAGLGSLRHLDLGHNQLKVLHNYTFSRLAQLTWLGLAFNCLQRLEAGAMTGLNRLINLDLSNNHLFLNFSADSPRVFRSLGQLQVLRVDTNDQLTSGEYPGAVFNDLVSLTYLSIDTGYTVHFGRDFAALRHIHTLDLSKKCRLNHLSNNSFAGFRNSTLSFIHLEYCQLMIMELCAFCGLSALDRLWVIHMDFLSPNKVMESLYGLQNQTMSEIKLHRLGSELTFTHVINEPAARYLQNICVQNLTMTDCNIKIIRASVVKGPLFRCLKHLDLSMNALIGDPTALLKLLWSNISLQSLAVQDQQRFAITQAQCLVNQNFQCRDDLLDNGIYWLGHPWSYTSCTNTPPNMTYLNMSSFLRHVNPLPAIWKFPTAKQLKTLDLSYLGFHNCHMTFHGLETLEMLSLNGNDCYDMTETMFDFMHSLKTLSVSNLGLNPHFLRSRGWRLFQNLHQLQTLDLSRNELPFTDPDMLRAQRSLKEVDFSYNPLRKLPLNLDNHGDLRMLDLSHAFLTTLTSSEMAALDRQANRHEISLKLLGNPLECACFNLDVVQWLWHTPVSLDGEGRKANYTCTAETGEITSTERVMAQWMNHWRRCVGVQMFGVALSALLVQLLAIVVAFIIVRSWTQLCYALKAVRRLRLPRRHHFLRDAYVVYSDAQDDVILACRTLRHCLEGQHGVRLLLRDREELPGSVRAENVVQHIDSSWKVVLLVTRGFSQDEWACGFAVQQAQRSITDTMPDRVIVVFLEKPQALPAMPSLQLLLRMVPERNILHVPRHSPPQHHAWKTLADLIVKEE